MKANENPFRSSNVERIRYALDCSALNRLVDTALELRLSSLIGPHGTGKTTLLEDLEPLLNERGHPTHWLRLNLDSSPDQRKAAIEQIQTLAPKCFCLFDGAEVVAIHGFSQGQKIQRERALRSPDASAPEPRSVPVSGSALVSTGAWPSKRWVRDDDLAGGDGDLLAP